MDIDIKYILENIPAFVYLIDKENTIRYINKVANYDTIEAVKGLKLSDIFLHEHECQKVSKAVKKVFLTGAAQQLDITIDNPRWRRLWFSTHLIPYQPKDGKFDYVIGINYDNSELIKTRNNSMISEQKFRSIVEGTRDDVLLVNQDLIITYYNKSKERPSLAKKIIGNSVFNFIAEDELDKMRKIYASVMKTGKTIEYELEGTHPDYGYKWYEGRCSLIKTEEGIDSLIIQTRDISEARLKELKSKDFNEKLESLVEIRTEELQKANEEIKTLLKEMHHRVKNNLQIISSLINIQSGFVNEETKKALGKSKERIYTMSLIHEMLYRNDNLSEINVAEYLNTLLQNHLRSFSKSNTIHFEIKNKSTHKNLSIDTMIPIGLLINELVTNSIKHAFHKTVTPTITILFVDVAEKKSNLIYRDNGSGIQKNNSSSSLGQDLIDCFVEQLDASYTLETSEEGVCYEFTLPIN